MKDKHNENHIPEQPFEVVERKATVFTRIGNAIFRHKVRRQVKQSDRKDPHLIAYQDDLKTPPQVVSPHKAAIDAEPEKPKVREQVRAHLESGKSITVLECLRMFHSTELRHVIAELRKTMTIQDEYQTTTDGKRYKRYFC